MNFSTTYDTVSVIFRALRKLLGRGAAAKSCKFLEPSAPKSFAYWYIARIGKLMGQHQSRIQSESEGGPLTNVEWGV